MTNDDYDFTYFDVETTGRDPATDRIVELAMIRQSAIGEELDRLVTIVNPGVPIPPDVVKVHGINDERVRDAPTFAEVADNARRLTDNAVLVTYNGRAFDILFLHCELYRATGIGLQLDETREIDLWRLWQTCEPRNLAGALKRFLNHDMGDSAHNAEADTDLLPDLLRAMVQNYNLHGNDAERLSKPVGEVDRSGRFKKSEDDGEIVFAFGKHRDEPVRQRPGYLKWMLNNDFPPDTQAWAKRLLARR